MLEFLCSKFGDCILSRNTENHRPPYSPDLSPLDYSFWGQAMAHVVWTKPYTLEELKGEVEDFARHFDPDKARRMAKHCRYRAQLCVSVGGGHFEHLIKKKR